MTAAITPRRFAHYVALGDSTTEGLDDPDGAGGYRGWADRLAARIATQQGALAYANLGVRGRCAHEIKAEQLGPALALHPDLATVVAGMNDLLRPGFDAHRIAGEIGEMQRALVARGCVVVTFTIPDIAHRLTISPIARILSARTHALDDEIRHVSAASGAILLDLAAHPVACDPRMWSRDRLHANPDGHPDRRRRRPCARAPGLRYALARSVAGGTGSRAARADHRARPLGTRLLRSVVVAARARSARGRSAHAQAALAGARRARVDLTAGESSDRVTWQRRRCSRSSGCRIGQPDRVWFSS